MPEALIPYRKVRGAGRGTFERVRLFFGPDHLLQVKSTGHSETYSRFYFRDNLPGGCFHGFDCCFCFGGHGGGFGLIALDCWE